MGELSGIYAIWYREIVSYLRQKPRLISSLASPVLWIFIFGVGLGSAIASSVLLNNVGYEIFIFPGIMILNVLFSTIFFGMNMIWDRKMGFLKEVLVAPISRTSTFIGKVLGGATDAIIQSVFLIAIVVALALTGIVKGAIINIYSVSGMIGVLFLTIFGLVSIGLIIGALIESAEGFQLITTFAVFPLFILSGALFPLNGLPKILSFAAKIDPMTYSVDVLRYLLIGKSQFNPLIDILIIGIFSLMMLLIGVFIFKRMKA